MADTSINVSEGTAGTVVPIDMRSESSNGHLRQVIVLGDPSTNAGVAPVDATYGLGVDVKRITGTMAVTQSGTWDEVGINDSGNSITVDAPVGTPVFVRLSDGASAITTLPVSIAAAVAVTDNSGSLTVDDGGSSLTVDGTITASNTAGDIAHDGVDSGNPIKIGGRAIAHGTNPTAVAAADRTDWLFNRAGVPWVIGGHPNVVTVEAEYTAAQTNTAIVTVSSGSKIVITAIQVTCDNANTVDVGLRVGFGATTTPTTTGVVLSHPGIAPGSGVVRGDGSGILGVGADGEDLRITSEVPTSGAIRVVATYYTVSS